MMYMSCVTDNGNEVLFKFLQRVLVATPTLFYTKS